MPLYTNPETLNSLEIIAVQREYGRRFAGATSRADYLKGLYSIRAELYPTKRYPGEPK
jgi:hypothetical protein